MKKLMTRIALLLIPCLTLFSFANAPGGEGFEVYLNGKLVLQRFGTDLNKPHTLRFAAGTANDEISFRYYHCGQPGKERVLIVKDSGNKTLREISFGNEENTKAGMQCRVSDLISLRKNETDVLKLYYRSSEIPDGRLLVSIVTDKQGAAVRP